MMRAVQVRRPGPLHTHRVENVADLVPADRGVVIDVKAAAVNYPDLLVVSGRYQTTPPTPFAPGKEAAGIVREVGPGVTRVKPGDRVLVHVEFGAYATQARAREDQCMPLPDRMGFVDAVAVGLAAQTAWFALLERARLQPGDVVLVNGVTGAVGHAAVQIASALGATVLAGASSPARAESLLKDMPCPIVDLGASDLRNSLREQVHAATEWQGSRHRDRYAGRRRFRCLAASVGLGWTHRDRRIRCRSDPGSQGELSAREEHHRDWLAMVRLSRPQAVDGGQGARSPQRPVGRGLTAAACDADDATATTSLARSSSSRRARPAAGSSS